MSCFLCDQAAKDRLCHSQSYPHVPTRLWACAADLRHHWDSIQGQVSDGLTHVLDLWHRLCSFQLTASDMLLAAALLAGLLLAALLVRKALQRQVCLLLFPMAPAVLQQHLHQQPFSVLLGGT